MRYFFMSLGFLTCLFPLPVFANLRSVSPQGEVVEIQLSPARAVTLSFRRSGEVIERVWIDNQSFFTVNADGCLSGLAETECEAQGASVLHLRRIEQQNIPGLMRADTAQVTVLTNGKTPYVFRIIPTNESSISVVEVIPSSSDSLPLIRAGLASVQSQNLLQPSSPLWGRLNHFVLLLERGQTPQSAAREAGVSWELVSYLIDLGRNPEV